MAQVLVFGRNNHHPDPVIDKLHCWKKGDIVHIASNNWIWGDMECIPNFYILRLNIPIHIAQKYSTPEFHPLKKNNGIFTKGEIKRKSRYHIDLTSISPQDIHRIKSTTGIFTPTITENQIQDKSLWLP